MFRGTGQALSLSLALSLSSLLIMKASLIELSSEGVQSYNGADATGRREMRKADRGNGSSASRGSSGYAAKQIWLTAK